MSRRIYYMHDNHTFSPLPPDVNAAVAHLYDLFHGNMGSYGMLCTKEGPMAGKVEHAGREWADFAPRARDWLFLALQPTAAEIEYDSWGRPWMT